MKKFLFIAFLFCILSPSFGQNGNKPLLANQYLQNEEFAKASELYEELFDKTPSRLYYSNLLYTYFKLEELEKAEKLAKSELRSQKEKSLYYADLGYIESLKEDPKSAGKNYNNAVKELTPNEFLIDQLSKTFVRYGNVDYAIKTIITGRKQLLNPLAFSLELAGIYRVNGQFDLAIEEYLNIVEYEASAKAEMQNKLQESLVKPENQEMLKNALYKRIQNNPNSPIFNEMLIWLQLQQKDFNGALIQAKALDRRFKENGQRVMQLGDLFMRSSDYETAEKAFKYVIDKGNESLNYLDANLKYLEVKKNKITESSYTNDDLVELESVYYSFLRDFGKSSQTVFALKDLAHLQAFYLDKLDTAISVLKEAIDLPGLNPQAQAQCKLELGDVLLLNNTIWEASLIYSQVDKKYKDDPIGREAKFRNARLYYYAGDFEWAKTLLFILRTSTSQLTANDALDLGLLIADNTGLDSTVDAMKLFAKADLLRFQNKFSESLLTLDSLEILYPDHPLDDEVLFVQAQIFKKTGEIDQVIAKLEKIVSDYGTDILADNAVFQLAEIYDKFLNQPEKAMEYYKLLLTDYPGSLLSVEARKRFRFLRGDVLVN
ncbi:MAG: tetratricopeptide (TPR) repeat protein [Sphingobacteriales bacterium]|jgi:tetratricopeptide (TPR) repeat protein